MILVFKKLSHLIPLITTFKKCSTSFGDPVKTSKIGPITCIGLNRPQNKNCLNAEILGQLKIALEVYESDSSSFAGVLYGEQGNFSHGFDRENTNENLEEIQQLLQDIVEKFSQKPIIAAINGFAVGPGLDLALWCDFRIVEDTAVLAAYARTYGMPLNDETARRLISLVGIYRALDWVLTGRIVKAKEALDCGIATRIVACGTALGQAINFANSLCNMPQACLRADRATLLSLTDKFSSPVAKKIIMEEKKNNIELALEEFKQGIYVTDSGDVRRK